ncbi:PTPLA-domain-containing protein [Phaeosphaeriaceae sp. SRC1lsM3a]|nr:PTPLA-domain-containing protein [Stagonospora sp. SRC1lsM3a]
MAQNHSSTSANNVTPRTFYLTAYNLLFSTLWTSILITSITQLPNGKIHLFNTTAVPARWIQTTSLIEVVHAATGLIKSPVSTTALQVVTRVIQVWMVWFSFPESTAESNAYGALVMAWATADAIRYAYLAANLWGSAPGWLLWLRYTMFYPLYPIGIGAEWWLLYRAIEPAGRISAVIPPIFWFCLMLYIPGSWKMYTYMIKQRKKTLGGQKKSN